MGTAWSYVRGGESWAALCPLVAPGAAVPAGTTHCDPSGSCWASSLRVTYLCAQVFLIPPPPARGDAPNLKAVCSSRHTLLGPAGAIPRSIPRFALGSTAKKSQPNRCQRVKPLREEPREQDRRWRSRSPNLSKRNCGDNRIWGTVATERSGAIHGDRGGRAPSGLHALRSDSCSVCSEGGGGGGVKIERKERRAAGGGIQ